MSNALKLTADWQPLSSVKLMQFIEDETLLQEREGDSMVPQAQVNSRWTSCVNRRAL